MSEPRSQEPVALVLAGGCARGAYELGVLSVLLPLLEDRGERPRILLGTSVGALNAAYFATNAHRPARDAVAEGERIWRGMEFSDIARHVVSLGSVGRALTYLGQVVGWPGARLRSLLDPAPLSGTIDRCVDFARLNENVRDGPLLAAAVVATSVLTHRSVVFHHGGGCPAFDSRRLIDYVPTPLAIDHVLASTAMPGVFPAALVKDPEEAAGWYYDGGTRLNAPLKPALALGAKRVLVIGLSSLSPGPRRIASDARPDTFAGLGLLLGDLIGEQLVQDIHTLAHVNEEIEDGRKGDRETVPYIIVTPEQPETVERLAHTVFRERYGGLGGLLRSSDIEIFGRLTGAGDDVSNATQLSVLLFDREFIELLIELGASDARRWISEQHDGPEGLWQLRSL